MPRKPSENICCVCLGTTLKLYRLNIKDSNKVSLHTKLKICISEIKWLSSYQICEQCTKLLHISYTFRETCVKSELVRQNKVYKKSEQADSEVVKHETEKEECDEKPEKIVELPDELDQLEVHFKYETPNDEIHEANSDNYADCVASTSDIEEEDQSKIVKHEREQQSRRPRKKLQFTCEICSHTYHSSIKLVNHCIKDHGMKKLDVRPFICDRCPSRFCNSSNLLQHMKYHDAVRSNMCTYCGKGFITKTDLNIHEKQHLNRREYRCDECGKCFNTHKDIRSHKLVVHTDSNHWKYCCEICNKPFPIKSNYDSHMRRHAGERKFECHLCHRKFIDKCVMQRHMKTHSNVREFKCTHCEREYKDPSVLKVHMAKNHGIGLGHIKIPLKEKKYICHICPKSYYAKNKLTRHLYTHSGEKPYDCPLCGKKFNDKSYVKQHLKKTHNTDEVPTANNETNMSGINREPLCFTDVNIKITE